MGEQPACTPIKGAQYASISVPRGKGLRDSDRLSLMRTIVRFGFYPIVSVEGELAAQFGSSYWMLVQCEPEWLCDEVVGFLHRQLPLVAKRLSTEEAYEAGARAGFINDEHYQNEAYERGSAGHSFDHRKSALRDLREMWLNKVGMAMFPSEPAKATQDTPLTPQEVAQLRTMLAGSSMRS